MPKLKFDEQREKLYETGVDQVVLYPMQDAGSYDLGVAWNGITAVNETPEGGEPEDLYADNIKYLSLVSAEKLGLGIEAYMYPDEWAECDGSAEPVPGVHIAQQERKTFGLCYRTVLGNDVEHNDYGYKLHLVYGCLASPSERGYATINDSPEAITFSWDANTTPVPVTGHKPTALLTIDSTKFKETAPKARLQTLLDILYGTDPDTEAGTEGTVARLPLPDEVLGILKEPTPTPPSDG